MASALSGLGPRHPFFPTTRNLVKSTSAQGSYSDFKSLGAGTGPSDRGSRGAGVQYIMHDAGWLVALRRKRWSQVSDVGESNLEYSREGGRKGKKL